jgi:hypothetical protein
MKRFVMAAVLLLTLTACGNGSDGSDGGAGASDDKTASESPGATATTPPPGVEVPSCSSVWKIGKILPKDYLGCEADDGGFEAPVITPECVAVAYSDSLWAVPGGPVTQAAGFALDDPDFQAAC